MNSQTSPRTQEVSWHQPAPRCPKTQQLITQLGHDALRHWASWTHGVWEIKKECALDANLNIYLSTE